MKIDKQIVEDKVKTAMVWRGQVIIDDSHLLIGLTQRKRKLSLILMNGSRCTPWSKAPTEAESLSSLRR